MTTAESTETTYGGTFTFPSLCRPWKACSTDETRPAFCHPYLYRRDDGLWLCASDTYIAVAVKVNEGPGAPVQDGFVPRKVAKLVRRGCEAKQLSATAWSVVVEPPYHEATYDLAGVLGSKPTSLADKLESVDLWGESSVASSKSFGERITFAFNPTLTEHIHQALGGMSLKATVVGPLAAIRYRARYSMGVGLQMPIIRMEDDA